MGGIPFQPDAVIFVLSQYSLSAGALRRIGNGLADGAELPSLTVRLEETDLTLPRALDQFSNAGHRSILIQPLGFPFPEGMRSWLEGALGNWLSRQNSTGLLLALGRELITEPAMLGQIAANAVATADTAVAVDTGNTALGKPGWNELPDFTHHLLVCTGPRCQYRDASSLAVALKTAIARAGHSRKCLTTRTGCMFPCNKGPLVAVYPKGEWYHLEDAADVSRFVDTVIGSDQTLPDRLVHIARDARAPAHPAEPVTC